MITDLLASLVGSSAGRVALVIGLISLGRWARKGALVRDLLETGGS